MTTRLILTGRRVHQGEEHREEEQCRTEVALDHDDPEGDRPHRDHRREVRQGRQADGSEPRVLLDQEGPVLGQVPREEHDEDDLQQLRRLTGERPDAERQPLTGDVGAEHEGEQQETDADRRPRVLVPSQPAVGTDHDAERRRDGEPEQQPDQLHVPEAQRRTAKVHRHEVLREPLHQEERDAAEQPDHGEQHLVGPSTRQDLCDVRDGERREVDRHALRGIHREPAGESGTERDASDDQRDGDDPKEARLGPPRPGMDVTQDTW